MFSPSTVSDKSVTMNSHIYRLSHITDNVNEMGLYVIYHYIYLNKYKISPFAGCNRKYAMLMDTIGGVCFH